MSSLTQTLLPMALDGLETDTSDEQIKTENLIHQLLAQYLPKSEENATSPSLNIDDLVLTRENHIRYLNLLLGPLPAPFTSLDASRPWLLYWCIHSLHLINAQLDTDSRLRAINTIKSFWNKESGGFGGGPGQMAHLAPTYASVSALAYLGAPGEAWHWIDRQALHDWMLTLKQPDGSFVMHVGGEVDVRGCYCALTTAVLLNILTPDLARGTSEFVASCQTYEGGLASASHPLPTSAPQLGEAHGGYTFCALASYFALEASPSLTASASPQRLELNTKSLLRWASSMQGLPIEAGGFRGRSNKLVDGCYSWWCGGLFSILGAMLPSPEPQPGVELFNRVALQEYVLIAAQSEHGGLRDKPGKGSDAYHSCYNLSGLSAAQHAMVHNEHETRRSLTHDWQEVAQGSTKIVKGKNESLEEANSRMRDIFVTALAWRELEDKKIIVGKPENEVQPTHPVYNITMEAFEKMVRWSYGQPAQVGIVEIASEV